MYCLPVDEVLLTAIAVRRLVVRLFLLDSTVVVYEDEGILIVWIDIASGPFVTGTEVA